MQAQVSVDDDADLYGDNADNARTYSRQGSASGFLPVKEAAAGFKGAFRKVANGIAGNSCHALHILARLPGLSIASIKSSPVTGCIYEQQSIVMLFACTDVSGSALLLQACVVCFCIAATRFQPCRLGLH